MNTINLSAISDADRGLCADIATRCGVNLRDCYQCGKCSAGCPMAEEMDLPPQKIMRMLQLGLADQALGARAPWICAQCSSCSSRCPQNIDITAIMREVRRESHAQGRGVVKESEVFEDLFIQKVRGRGRSNEQYLAAFYNLKSGHLTQDLMSAPKMFKRGLIGVKPHSVKDRGAVKRLIDKCAEAERKKRISEGEGGASR